METDLKSLFKWFNHFSFWSADSAQNKWSPCFLEEIMNAWFFPVIEYRCISQISHSLSNWMTYEGPFLSLPLDTLKMRLPLSCINTVYCSLVIHNAQIPTKKLFYHDALKANPPSKWENVCHHSLPFKLLTEKGVVTKNKFCLNFTA